MAGTEVNAHGLSRYIPADVKRAVRKACGFGCVVCGAALYQYEHIDPIWADATVHDPERIALLCAACHDKVTRGRGLSKDDVAKARRSPRCLMDGFTREFLVCGDQFGVHVNLGPIVMIQCNPILRVLGTDLISVSPAETIDGPAQLNARFEDADGHVLLDIVRSELMVRSDNWDVEIVGPMLTIWDDKRRVVMELESKPRHSLRFLKLRLRHRGFSVVIDQEGVGFGIMDDPPRCLQGGIFFGGVAGDRCALDFTADGLIVMNEMRVPYPW